MMEEKEQPLVSVVVPVYKVEKWIARCIESILNQTHKNLELILVNDGSPDRSGEICDEYAKKDSRVKVIHTPNRGVSCARNTGIENTQGEYLLFVDSDDWVECNHIETLLPVEGEDLVYSGRKIYVNGIFVEERAIPAQMVYREEWLSDYTGFIGRGLTLFFASGCYNVNLIRQNNIRFNTNLRISEDGLFNLVYMNFCSKIRYADTTTYCYEDGDDSVVSLSRTFHPRRMDAALEKIKAIENMTNRKEYVVRWNEWHGVLGHFRKWETFNEGIHKKQAKEELKRVYNNQFVRESIFYIRKNGTLDQKIESYFMRYWLFPLYAPFYRVVVLLSKIKRLFVRK